MSLSTTRWGRTTAAAVTAVAALATTLAMAAPARAENLVTPGNFTGYGFDQCVAPTQSAMDAWLNNSPYWAVGIYISGASRGCRSQPNLTPTWISTQLAAGWRLLPITLGPQAWCTTRERYLHQVRISPKGLHSYGKARRQGRNEAAKSVDAAQRLGISAGSTLWYDIEAFNSNKTACRESAISFLSAWTRKLHKLHYVSGVYSSAASGIKMLDDTQANRPGTYAMPDQLWIADWNDHADVLSSYIRSSSWMPHMRVHQYRGGHNETYGGVTINIDNNFLDLGKGSTARRAPQQCGGVSLDFPTYKFVQVGDKSNLVKAAQCLFVENEGYRGKVSGVFNNAFGKAVARFRGANGLVEKPLVSRRSWSILMTEGATPLVKYGAAQPAVRRLQRALNAVDSARLPVTGVFAASTTIAVKKYQSDHKLTPTGVVTSKVWSMLQSGIR
jgi:peptidoglycan hydrolase-like protein with peptidoglycan-binding domain